jgi:hypothetical protein
VTVVQLPTAGTAYHWPAVLVENAALVTARLQGLA